MCAIQASSTYNIFTQSLLISLSFNPLFVFFYIYIKFDPKSLLIISHSFYYPSMCFQNLFDIEYPLCSCSYLLFNFSLLYRSEMVGTSKDIPTLLKSDEVYLTSSVQSLNNHYLSSCDPSLIYTFLIGLILSVNSIII